MPVTDMILYEVIRLLILMHQRVNSILLLLLLQVAIVLTPLYKVSLFSPAVPNRQVGG